jgi:uncharacterized protein YgfB (UPF0149 family)
MATYKNWDALMKAVQKKVDSTLQNEVFEEARDVCQKHIDEDVYGAYSPTSYQRRDMSGGLIANENIIGEMTGNVLEVKDIAQLNTSEGKQTYNSQTYLAQIIEYGKAYTGNAVYLFDRDMSDQPWANPRPFIQNTIEDLIINKQHIKAMKAGLAQRGIKTE